MLEKFLKGLGSQAGQDALFLLGATMKDISGGGTDNFMGAQQMLAGRRKEADELEAFDALASGLFGNQGAAPVVSDQAGGAHNLTGPDLQGNPGEMGGMTPEMRGRIAVLRKGRNLDALLRLYEANQPTYQRGEDGFYEMRQGVAPRLVTKFPEKERPVSPGWQENPDGTWSPIKNGPYDPDYIAKTSGIRREAIVDRPMPSRPRSGGGVAASPGVPQTVAGQPWKKYGGR